MLATATMDDVDALVLFDIDGTLIRRARPHRRQALVEAIRKTVSVETTTEGVPVAGMLDHDIIATMMTGAGMRPTAIRKAMPAVIRHAQWIYFDSAPDLARKVCPGVRRVLGRLQRRGVVIGLVTRESHADRLAEDGARRVAAIFSLWRLRGVR
jgi:phosphoglycolate phosphatase